MQRIYKPTDYDLVWAEVGSKSDTIRDKIPTGWEVEIPAREDMNALQNRQDRAIAYLLQIGVAEYDNNSIYYVGAVVNLNGLLYKATAQSQGINPETSANRNLYWEKLSATYPEFLAIKNRIESADPFTQYLLKSAPQTNATYVGSGLASNINQAQGFFFNGNFTEFRYNTTVIGRVPSTVLSSDDNSKNFATTEWVQNLIRESLSKLEVKVGESIITNSNINPSITKGYGTWVLDCQGKSVVGFSEVESHPAWTKTGNNTFGQYDVTLTTDQIPTHDHVTDSRFNKFVAIASEIYGDASIRQGTITSEDFDYSDQEIGVASINSTAKILMSSRSVGGSQSHNNVQPSQVKYIWTRIS